MLVDGCIDELSRAGCGELTCQAPLRVLEEGLVGLLLHLLEGNCHPRHLRWASANGAAANADRAWATMESSCLVAAMQVEDLTGGAHWQANLIRTRLICANALSCISVWVPAVSAPRRVMFSIILWQSLIRTRTCMSLLASCATCIPCPCFNAVQALLHLLFERLPRPGFHGFIDQHADKRVHGCVLYLPL